MGASSSSTSPQEGLQWGAAASQYHPILGPPVLVADPRVLTASGNAASVILRQHLVTMMTSQGRGGGGVSSSNNGGGAAAAAVGELVLGGGHSEVTVLSDAAIARGFMASEGYHRLACQNVERGRSGTDRPPCSEEAVRAAIRNATLPSGATVLNEEWDAFYGPPVRKRRFVAAAAVDNNNDTSVPNPIAAGGGVGRSTNTSAPAGAPAAGPSPSIASAAMVAVAKDRFVWRRAVGGGDIAHEKQPPHQQSTQHLAAGHHLTAPYGNSASSSGFVRGDENSNVAAATNANAGPPQSPPSAVDNNNSSCPPPLLAPSESTTLTLPNVALSFPQNDSGANADVISPLSPQVLPHPSAPPPSGGAASPPPWVGVSAAAAAADEAGADGDGYADGGNGVGVRMPGYVASTSPHRSGGAAPPAAAMGGEYSEVSTPHNAL